jgi:hypothetical protein
MEKQNGVSTQVNTHVIVTYTKSHHFITHSQYEALPDLGSKDWFQSSDGSRITGGNIAEVLTIEKFYEVHPDLKPAVEFHRTDELMKELGFAGTLEAVADNGLKAMQSFVEGLKNSIRYMQDNKQPTSNAEKLLKRAQFKLETLKAK